MGGGGRRGVFEVKNLSCQFLVTLAKGVNFGHYKWNSEGDGESESWETESDHSVEGDDIL